MQAGRRSRAVRLIRASVPRFVGVVVAVMLIVSAAPGAFACCRPPGPAGAGRPPAAAFAAADTADTADAVDTAADATADADAKETALAMRGADAARTGSHAARPHCSGDPADVQAPCIEAPDYRPPSSSAAHADGVIGSASLLRGFSEGATRSPDGMRGGSGPPLWLRTCVSRT